MAHVMLRNLRKRLQKLKNQKQKHFDDFEPIIKYCVKHFSHLFPRYRETGEGSRVVFHFNVKNVDPISLEREHGSRDHIPPRYAKRAIGGIEDLLNFIEASVPNLEVEDDEENGTDSENFE